MKISEVGPGAWTFVAIWLLLADIWQFVVDKEIDRWIDLALAAMFATIARNEFLEWKRRRDEHEQSPS